MALYAGTIFLSAFLLFQVQLIVAKRILPWFGGSAAVWTTCMLFFQGVLLLGYLYADRSVRGLRPRAQAYVHIVLLAASLAMLPVLPGPGWKPAAGTDPSAGILALLAATVGLPYFALSATSPLLQAWYARGGRGTMPYRLFALSNAGSMLGLLSYPAAIEPLLPVRRQAQGWSLLFLVFAALCGAIAFRSRAADAARPDGVPAGEVPPPSPGDRFLWAALPACASILLLAVTNHLTQNVAPIPFLWAFPLAIYLLSFILCFSGEGRWYRRAPYLALLAPLLCAMSYLLSRGQETASLAVLVPVYATGLFVSCMVLHGELARSKPDPARLTGYYLLVSLGGALGGIFVGLVAPYGFRGYYELPGGIAACAALVLLVLYRDRPREGPASRWEGRGLAAATAAVAALAASLAWQAHAVSGEARLMERNFYGGLKVADTGRTTDRDALRTLIHGTITHGRQFLAAARRREPTTYYGKATGAGLAIIERGRRGGIRVGIIGLGAGTLAAYGRRGDTYRFYEINPLVVRLAQGEFSFLRDTRARVEVVPGDARLSLESEVPQRFDVLVVDAFSGDAIPVHLLTTEAFDLYFRHLSPGGILAVHATNRYLDLQPVAARAAELSGKTAMTVETEDDRNNGLYRATWILVTDRPSFFERPEIRRACRVIPVREGFRTWTDDYSNLLQAIK